MRYKLTFMDERTGLHFDSVVDEELLIKVIQTMLTAFILTGITAEIQQCSN